MAIWISFADLAWNAYSRPKKFGFWRVWTPKRYWSSSKPPKGTSLAETVLYMPILVQIRPLVRHALRETKESKRREERNLQWQTGCSPRPLTLTQRYVVLHAGWSLGDSYKFQVSSKSRLNGFRDVGGRNLPLLRPVAYIKACTYIQAVNKDSPWTFPLKSLNFRPWGNFPAVIKNHAVNFLRYRFGYRSFSCTMCVSVWQQTFCNCYVIWFQETPKAFKDVLKVLRVIYFACFLSQTHICKIRSKSDESENVLFSVEFHAHMAKRAAEFMAHAEEGPACHFEKKILKFKFNVCSQVICHRFSYLTSLTPFHRHERYFADQ